MTDASGGLVELGQGHFAVVYLAQLPGVEVAVKVGRGGLLRAAWCDGGPSQPWCCGELAMPSVGTTDCHASPAPGCPSRCLSCYLGRTCRLCGMKLRCYASAHTSALCLCLAWQSRWVAC